MIKKYLCFVVGLLISMNAMAAGQFPEESLKLDQTLKTELSKMNQEQREKLDLELKTFQELLSKKYFEVGGDVVLLAGGSILTLTAALVGGVFTLAVLTASAPGAGIPAIIVGATTVAIVGYLAKFTYSMGFELAMDIDDVVTLHNNISEIRAELKALSNSQGLRLSSELP